MKWFNGVILCLSAVLLFFLCSSAIYAVGDEEEMHRVFEMRLDLTKEQIEQIKPILEDYFVQSQALADEMGPGHRPSGEEHMDAMHKNCITCHSKQEALLDKKLSDCSTCHIKKTIKNYPKNSRISMK